MGKYIGKFFYGCVRLFLKSTAPVQDSGTIRLLIRWYRKTGIKIVQTFLPLFGNYIMLSLTTRCQCACAHCGVAVQRKYGEENLDETLVYKIIEESARLGAYEIYFFGGEVLLLPELPDYIAFAKKNGLMTRLDTNGLLLHEEMVVMLRNSGLDHIGVSIDSLNEEIHDKNRGIPGTLKRALQGISYCIKHNLDCSISTVASKQSLENGGLYNIIQRAAGLKIKARILSPVSCGRWKNRSDIALSPAEVRYVRGFLRRGKVFWDSELVDGPEVPFSCGARGRRLLYISPHGNVQPCSYVPIVFGNIKEIPFIEIINKMHRSDILSYGSDSLDCPTNSINFQNRYGRYMDTGVVIPSTLKCALYNESIYKKNRRSGIKTVEPVDDPTLARKQGAEVFNSAQALVPGSEKVAENGRA